ncbi:MAG: NADP-dependent oxidoreductase [Oligoflexales bacterium]|nr:NADP-dependent oxidoreductase [Oligoflexales bacterium]
MQKVLNKQIVLEKRPVGKIADGDMRFCEQAVEDIPDGAVLIQNQYVSIDPTHRIWMSSMRQYMDPIELGAVIRALGVGKVIGSKDSSLKAGDIVTGELGWQTHSVRNAKELFPVKMVPEPLSSLLSVYGLTGVTAYFGLLDIGEPKAGETVLVSGAAGAVGSVVGQIAKIKGCKVVGVCGSDEKCDWLVNEFGFDAAIQYKRQNIPEALKESCPEGIDVYFENVGGAILEHSLMQMNQFSRLVLCGLISNYNLTSAPEGVKNFAQILMQRIKVQGFIASDYLSRWPEAIAELSSWVQQGKIKYKEDIVEGLSQIPAAVNKLFDGTNSGKLMAKVN